MHSGPLRPAATWWWHREQRRVVIPERSPPSRWSPRSSMRSATVCRSWPPAASSTAAASPPARSRRRRGLGGNPLHRDARSTGVLGYKDKLLASREDQTTVSRAYSGKTMRVVQNEYTDYYDSHPEELEKFPEQLPSPTGTVPCTSVATPSVRGWTWTRSAIRPGRAWAPSPSSSPRVSWSAASWPRPKWPRPPLGPALRGPASVPRRRRDAPGHREHTSRAGT